jgi:3-oxoacyl-[acyl-carrier protein] reductase
VRWTFACVSRRRCSDRRAVTVDVAVSRNVAVARVPGTGDCPDCRSVARTTWLAPDGRVVLSHSWRSGGNGSAPPFIATNPTAPLAVGHSTSYVLDGSGIRGLRFGASPSVATGGLQPLLGPPAVGYRRGGSCTTDHVIRWRAGPLTAPLTLFFGRGRWVGYQYGDPGARTVPSDPGAPIAPATTRGLGLGETVALGRRLYGRAFTPSAAQGGSWRVRTVSGQIDGFVTLDPKDRQGPQQPESHRDDRRRHGRVPGVVTLTPRSGERGGWTPAPARHGRIAPMDLGLTDRACVVTGGSRGVGLETARRLCDEGAKVLMVGRGEDALRAAKATCAAGERAQWLALDITAPDAGERVVAACVSRFGRVDVLVNNAGTSSVRALEELEDTDWNAQWEMHVMAPMRLMRAAVPAMVAGGWGRVVNVSSSSGKRPGRLNVAYSVTKSAVLSLSRAYADNYARHGVLVNAVTPGPIASELWLEPGGLVDQTIAARGGTREQVLQDAAAGLPIRRLAQPGEIAAVIVFLCSEQASDVAGAAWSVDGGAVPVII